MTATIHYLNPPLREVPTQEIRSLYADLAESGASYISEQNMERVMVEMHDRMNPPIEFDYRIFWLVAMPIWGVIAFMFGFGIAWLSR